MEDRWIEVDGLRIRYLEAGAGEPVVFLHGGSLGSSADVFIRNMRGFAAQGLRAIAFDQPGFGLSQTPADHSVAYRTRVTRAVCSALGLERPALVAHSQAGGMAVQLALDEPDAFSRLVILGTGSLLPPLKEKGDGRDAVAQARLERRMAVQEPTIDDTRKLLEANLFHHDLITPEELALRHARSTGEAFRAFVARGESEGAGAKPATPLWRRLGELKPPLLMIYGREDRGDAHARALMLQEAYPGLALHIVHGCKHLVPWDAEAEVARLAIPFLKS
jgi:4,5:9,10-diseco-3-hydroxy-5,9,17-trioxoandrosta-1(10),2-diene-4-oate hydrolase